MNNGKRPLPLLLFALVCLIQLGAALYMAWHWEDILRSGQRFYWMTAPVDPYDAFKGRYIDLRFKEDSGPVTDGSAFVYGQTAYARIGVNNEGHAVILGISAQPPAGQPYIKARTSYTQGNKVHVLLPFKRYYLPEDMAVPAETAYRQNAGKTGIAVVRLKDGYGVIEDVLIDNHPLRDYLKQQPSSLR